MHFVRFFTCIASCFSVARAFSVTVGAPTQCDPLTISWTGGQEPFEILLTPNNEAYQNYSVPTSAFSNGKGSYSIPWLSLLAQTQFLLTMSDATGFGSGGTTDILTVGNQVGNTNCHAAVQPPPYTFSMNPNPSPPGYLVPQCSEIKFTANSNAAPVVPPITIVQLIPGGQSVVINSMEASYTLDALDVNVGTTLMYFVTDSMGVQCGASRFYTVSGSSDSSCLIKPPTSTAGMSVTATATTTLPPSPLHLVQTEMLLLSQARQAAAAARCLLHWSSSACACRVNGKRLAPWTFSLLPKVIRVSYTIQIQNTTSAIMVTFRQNPLSHTRQTPSTTIHDLLKPAENPVRHDQFVRCQLRSWRASLIIQPITTFATELQHRLSCLPGCSKFDHAIRLQPNGYIVSSHDIKLPNPIPCWLPSTHSTRQPITPSQCVYRKPHSQRTSHAVQSDTTSTPQFKRL
ncbi:hypothetical protein BDR07DRAFT_268032 [Suillus spraguei]|nr:hypothetical protein BDR07DRAFT_268032 [Suillus spraguei]